MNDNTLHLVPNANPSNLEEIKGDFGKDDRDIVHFREFVSTAFDESISLGKRCGIQPSDDDSVVFVGFNINGRETILKISVEFSDRETMEKESALTREMSEEAEYKNF